MTTFLKELRNSTMRTIEVRGGDLDASVLITLDTLR